MVLPKYYSDVHFGVVSIQALGDSPWICFFRVEFLWTVGFYGINEYRGKYRIVPWILWGCKCCSKCLLKHLDLFFLVIFHGYITMGFITIWKTTIWDTFWELLSNHPPYHPSLCNLADAIGDLCLWRFKCGYFYLSLGAQDGLVSIG